MSRLCRFYHIVPKDDDKSAHCHHLYATMDCQVKSCKFTTRPLSISDVKPAIEMMKLHMIGAHPELKGALEYNSKEKEREENSPNKASTEPKQQERDTNKDVTCTKCAKIFFSKKKCEKTFKNPTLESQ